MGIEEMIFISKFLKKEKIDQKKIKDAEEKVKETITKSRKKREFIENELEKCCNLKQ